MLIDSSGWPAAAAPRARSSSARTRVNGLVILALVGLTARRALTQYRSAA